MSRPLLTKVLADALRSTVAVSDEYWAQSPWPDDLVAGVPPDIADRLERALDVCQWQIRGKGLACGRLSHDHVHRHDEVCDMPGHAPRLECHPFQPLVTP